MTQEIISFNIISGMQVNKLSSFKEFVCRIFNIVPERLFIRKLRCEAIGLLPRPSHVISAADGRLYYVYESAMKSGKNEFTMEELHPSTSCNPCGRFSILYSAYKER